MSKQPSKTGSEMTTSLDATAATIQRWPRVIASPAVWESGSAAHRLGKMPRSLYRPRRLALSPEQRAIMW